jgi:hypothetical protein
MNDHTHVMTDEEWEENKDCELKKRDHKWIWKYDIASGTASNTEAICAHCGKHATINRDEIRIHESH